MFDGRVTNVQNDRVQKEERPTPGRAGLDRTGCRRSQSNRVSAPLSLAYQAFDSHIPQSPNPAPSRVGRRRGCRPDPERSNSPRGHKSREVRLPDSFYAPWSPPVVQGLAVCSDWRPRIFAGWGQLGVCFYGAKGMNQKNRSGHKGGRVGTPSTLITMRRPWGRRSAAEKRLDIKLGRIHQTYVELARVAKKVQAQPRDMRPRLRKATNG